MIIKKCSCGHEFCTSDIRPPLLKAEQGFLGGRVTHLTEIACSCGNRCLLYIRPQGQTWEVVGAEIIKKVRKKG